MNVKISFSSKDLSVYDNTKNLGQVIEAKIEHVLQKAEAAPYICSITKRQILMSETPFQDLHPNDYVRVPVVGFHRTSNKHAPGRKPTQKEQNYMISHFGLGLQFPHSTLQDLVGAKMRKLIGKRAEQDHNVIVLPYSKYYNDKGQDISNPQTKEEYHKNYHSGYVVMRSEPEKLSEIQRYLLDPASPDWLLYQFLHSRRKAIKDEQQAITSAIKKRDRAIENVTMYESKLLPLKTRIDEKLFDLPNAEDFLIE